MDEIWIWQEPFSNRALVRDESEKWPDDENGKPSEKWIKYVKASVRDDLNDSIECAVELLETAHEFIERYGHTDQHTEWAKDAKEYVLSTQKRDA